MKRPIKLVVFDFDGPILDSFGLAKKSVYKTRQRFIDEKIADKRLLPKPTKETFILSWGYPGVLTVKKMFPLISDKEAEIFIKTWAENEKEGTLPLVRGAKKALAEIRKEGLATALLTARSHNFNLLFKRFGLEKYFDFVQSFANPLVPQEKVHANHNFNSSHKDGPEFFSVLADWAEKKNISLTEAVFIDDTLTGLKIAGNAGLNFLGVCTGPLTLKKDWRTYGNVDEKYVIKSVAELPKWLEKNMRV